MSALNDFNDELKNTILTDGVIESDPASVNYSMAIEYGARLTTAEVFDNFIPGPVAGEGKNRRRFRVDGYQLDEADQSIHIIVTDFEPGEEIRTITKSDAENIFRQAEHFVEICSEGSIWDRTSSVNDQPELSSYIENSLETEVAKIRFHLFTNREISKQLSELSSKEICGKPADYQIWDLNRMWALALSAMGTEEFIIDFTEFTDKGLLCLKANETDEYEGYLAVISGETLAAMYDLYGSRLLEGNVRAYLGARGKKSKNQGILNTIREFPDKFFAYNNGISCISTGIELEQDGDALYLKSAKYLQIVNGGQTTASIYVAAKASTNGFSPVGGISVQMKLSVIKERVTAEPDQPDQSAALEDLISKIARYSNTQNTVNESDFFSNHEFHRVFESHSKAIQAPPIAGETTKGTYWFYERARGAYNSRTAFMSGAELRRFKIETPPRQKIEKIQLAKYIHAWEQLPHHICDSGQKNFKKFAETTLAAWGESGARYRTKEFFQETIAKAIMYRRLEKMVDKAPWYPKGSGYRQGVVSYTIALLSHLIQIEASGQGLNFKTIWQEQKLGSIIEDELMRIAERTCQVISAPAYETVANSKQGLEWFKNEGCWSKLKETHGLSLSQAFLGTLMSRDEVVQGQRNRQHEARVNTEVDQITEIMNIGPQGWAQLRGWTEANIPRYGTEADLIRQMTTSRFYPSPRQTQVLYRILRESRDAGFGL
ncbi:AIPR family protein [Litorivicinus sp.]|nr:AIPR family protein [Litorivicinus sp.]